MKRLLYPLIASALITIVPFLLTFEKGQDIVRGLFGYEYFALLLLIVFIKNKLARFSLANRKKMPVYTGMTIILISLIVTLVAIAWIDLQNQLAIKGWPTGWYGTLPFATCALAIAMVWKIKPFRFNAICFILFVALMFHLEANNRYAAQPLAQFPTIDYLERIAPKPVQRKRIAEDYKAKYIVTDSVTITRDYVDTARNNVIILVESWGLPLDIKRFERQTNLFNGITTAVGTHNRMYSRTRTAEREDLMQTCTRDSVTLHRDTTFLPKVFADIGFQTTFLFGGDSLEHYRYKYIRNIGFGEVIYGKTTSKGKQLRDTEIIARIDSILADTTQKHFIAWTTADTKFPMPEFPDIYYSNADAIDSAYSSKLHNDFVVIANLARRHPETRFIIQGDHNPILSPVGFQEKFYKRWVPFIVLN
ncbi:hypothetical protein SAMN05720761_12155 [Fibrobacter sp. UWCM]|uniref:hypothetical protein n=1 Tax=Fibrobacter sp. UWCM TaxID=1896208 RepID=UPI0009135DF1|nr:hypothetical protein [Fibrobacter sp. UWCM]SHH66947.1 hypothetical protein SAMN05720761_12155 [Fibrobacter sp. UWCM]